MGLYNTLINLEVGKTFKAKVKGKLTTLIVVKHATCIGCVYWKHKDPKRPQNVDYPHNGFCSSPWRNKDPWPCSITVREDTGVIYQLPKKKKVKK